MTTAAARRPHQASGSRHVATRLAAEQRAVARVVGRLPGASARDVHRGRVAARRLRSVLKIYSPLFQPRRARLYRADLRSFARALAPVREADVLAALFAAEIAGTATLDEAEKRRVAAALEDAKREVRDSLAQRAAGGEWAGLVAALKAHARDPDLWLRRDAGLREVLGWADASWRKAVRMLENAPQTADELHELRLALKHCRYALEVVAEVEARDAERLLRRLRAVQDSIGEHRDVVLAQHWVSLNERRLGRATSRRLSQLLAKRERRTLKQASAASAKVLPAYRRWRTVARRVRESAAA